MERVWDDEKRVWFWSVIRKILVIELFRFCSKLFILGSGVVGSLGVSLLFCLFTLMLFLAIFIGFRFRFLRRFRFVIWEVNNLKEI